MLLHASASARAWLDLIVCFAFTLLYLCLSCTGCIFCIGLARDRGEGGNQEDGVDKLPRRSMADEEGTWTNCFETCFRPGSGIRFLLAVFPSAW